MRTIVLAGVGPNLGESLARGFVDRGANVAMFARSADYLRELADDIGERALAVPTDITDEDEVAAGFERVRDEFGRADCLVHNAYATGRPRGGVLDTSPDEFEAGWRVKAGALHLLAREAVPDMDGDGTIVVTGSPYAHRPGGNATYDSATPAIYGLAASMARDLDVQVSYVVVDGTVSSAGSANGIAGESVAETYWWLFEQSADARTFELDIRPRDEVFRT